MVTLLRVETPGQCAVELTAHMPNSKQFTVRYGADVRSRLDYTQAAHRFGECVFHALACNGGINND